MSRRLIAASAIVFAFFWGLWADYGSSIAGFFLKKDQSTESAGQWGDSFGPFTAAVSAVGIVTVLVTLSQQRKAISDQANDLYRQRFESSFFELLKLLQSLRSELSYRYSQGYIQSLQSKELKSSKPHSATTKSLIKISSVSRTQQTFVGRSAIIAALLDARHYIDLLPSSNITMKGIGSIYMAHIQPRSEPTFSPFFRIIYTILDRLRRDKVLSSDEKEDYSRLLRSQLSSHELSIIAINGCASISKDLDRLLIDFRMLKYHPPSKLDAQIRQAYPKSAFEPRPEPKTAKGIREFL